MIQFENVAKSYGARTLFENVSFRINARERIGLVGRNGLGKTTLFRMIVNEVHPDSGSIIIPKNYRMGHVEQEITFDRPTVLAECMKGLPENEKDHHWKAEKILMGLGFSTLDFTRDPFEFSGGFQVRLNLAKVLVSEPDLLLLDEPTNYLDITSIRWVADFLKDWPHEVMIITHDRGFMDRVVTHIVGIHRNKVRKIPGDTDRYYTQIFQEEEVYEKTRVNEEKKEKEVQLFISRFRAKARLANMVQSRIKALNRKDKNKKLEKLATLDFAFRQKPFQAKQVMEARDISFGYDSNHPLIRDFNLSVKTGDRICIIGKNGKGKTTLLKILAGCLDPNDGQVKAHPEMVKGYFEQNQISELVNQRTVLEEIQYTHGDVDPQTARNICGAMMFGGDDALKKIQVLSGGEKCRVVLGKVLVTPVNLLILDEPTNHLDMESSDALLAAIDNFDGTVIMVTHNEMFLHTLASRLVIFQNDKIEIFEDGYPEFLEKIGWQDEGDGASGKNKTAAKDGQALSKKEQKRLRSEFMAKRAKALNPLKERLSKTEKKIEAHEKELVELTQSMQEVSLEKDRRGIEKLSKAIFACQSAIDRLYQELETLTLEYEAKTALFESQPEPPE
ncbi:MAG: ATP-binding cassette domain-containing protein [Proteobacteria bacterium]|nr:ATP-binding cassette domain-containing protein [Pseudomonadota bacterium]